MNLVALPALADNYIWMLHDGHRAIVVDPGEAAPVQRALQVHRLELSTILVTHHHADHVGGVAALAPLLTGRIHGPARERLPFDAEPMRDGDTAGWLGLPWHVLDVPGHTAGHVAYACGGAEPLVFCGDTLFSAGCGRLFEGTPAQMSASLDRLAALPDDTLVCCTHEYTQANLRFAADAEPENAERDAWAAEVDARRAAGRPSLPSTIGRERAVNPFLRTREPALRAAARARGANDDDPVAVFAALRAWKDHHR